ncbi:hypothetical protein Misp01_32320 [Microtetraspora sp. NBRC 13810]|uniref:DUF6194 family protein n=1 Tax=Microtetraspora sp. NBRC 13810 TaxID=3030990 RepID=UPI0024A12B93|nr:DUF6194 family protein [Microtetraspora sp. NBRC 13810]GLW08102.1 hypothetical protein Misp01_32320 [Microtetraspora sp. NBRC 13810]
MTEDEIIEYVSGLPGTVATTAAEGDGSPEMAWGDSFFFYNPGGDGVPQGQLPYATIVTKDYEGFDSASDLNRPGVFRLNIAVGRARFQELVGFPPAAHEDHRPGIDYTVLDRILPHPLYATQSWICVLNPGEVTGPQVHALLGQAHTHAARRHRPQERPLT